MVNNKIICSTYDSFIVIKITYHAEKIAPESITVKFGAKKKK